MVLHFSSNLAFFPWLISPSLKWFEQCNFWDILWSLPTLKGLAMHNFWYFEKTHIFTRRIVFALFHDAIIRHACIEINKQLSLNVLQYTNLCLQSILSVYLIFNTNIQISTLNHSLEIRSLYIQIQVYSVRYVNFVIYTTDLLLIN